MKRIYETPSPDDGLRVLVDRLWPRGISRARAHLDLWLKEAAPSSKLRTWFGHRPDRWDTFKERYIKELDEKDDAIFEPIEASANAGPVTLLYAATDPIHNHANVLKDHLHQRFGLR